MKGLKRLLFLLILGITFTSIGQVNSNDTLFIQKDSVKGSAQSIFYAQNSNSPFYERINQWEFGTYDHRSYDYSLSFLNEQGMSLTKLKPVIPMTKWVILTQYNGAFYAYHPCDFNSHYRASFNDSTFIDWTGEGPDASKIVNQQIINDSTYRFSLSGVFEKDRKLIIHIIDKEKGIAIFEDPNRERHKYTLMISSDKIRSVPLIVNQCENKQIELRFEEPNYVELLRRE